MPKGKYKTKRVKPKVRVLKLEKLAPNKVALALEVEDAPEPPVEALVEPIQIEPEQPESQGLVKWLRGLW